MSEKGPRFVHEKVGTLQEFLRYALNRSASIVKMEGQVLPTYNESGGISMTPHAIYTVVCDTRALVELDYITSKLWVLASFKVPSFFQAPKPSCSDVSLILELHGKTVKDGAWTEADIKAADDVLEGKVHGNDPSVPAQGG